MEVIRLITLFRFVKPVTLMKGGSVISTQHEHVVAKRDQREVEFCKQHPGSVQWNKWNKGLIIVLPRKPLAPDAVLTPEKLGEIYAVAAQKPVEMLKAENYPAEKWEFLLRLMNLFQLSFPLSEDGQRQICPTLLRAEPPPETDEPQGADTVRLRYEFTVGPAPLLPRFTVRTFSLIEQAKLWQRGAMLRYPGARARVWTTAEEKYLFATVAGPEGDRTELLSILRSTLTELFTEYRDLKVREQRWFDGQRVPPGAQSWVEVFKEFQQFDMALTPIRDGIKAVVDRARARKRGRRA